MGSNRGLLANINMNSRSRAIASRLDGGNKPPGCNKGFPCERPARGLTKGMRGGGGAESNGGPLAGEDVVEAESLLFPKCK